MGHSNNLILWLLILLIVAYHPMGTADNTGNFHYQNEAGNYPYSVNQTGDNYTFEFTNNPGKVGARLKAAVHVLQSIYGDTSINPTYSETFMKESAQCFVFDANFYSYRACFLPNDYSPGNRERFWGFVTQLPNAMWLLTRNLLPALFGIGLFFYLFKKQ
jgi:hypothetical protein